MTPHYYRKQSIKGFFLLMILVIYLLATYGCTPKHGCYGTRGMSGYSWIKNKKTQQAFILDSLCHVICSFKDGTNMLHSQQTF